MMRSITLLLACFLLALSACNSPKPIKEHKNFLMGRWHRFSKENGYSEFDIDSQYIVFYNQKVGRFTLPYKIENDSLKYLSNPYAASITYYGDSILLQGNDSTTATLYKFAAVPFKSIPEVKDSLAFAAYLAGFDTRLIREFEKAGIKFSDAPETPSYEALLKRK